MKGKKVKNQSKLRTALSLVLATQLGWGLSPLAVLAEGENISNNSIPLAQPAPSQLVQKIWGSIDPRKFSKRIALRPEKKENKEAAAKETDTKTQDKTPSETNVTAAATETGQIVFKTAEPAESKSEAVTTEVSENSAAVSPENAAGTKPAETVATGNASPDKSSAIPADETKTAETSNSESKPVFSINKASNEGSERDLAIASNLISLPPGSVLGRMQSQQSAECVVVDNDEAEEVEETIKQEDLPTDDGKTRAKAGARFPVVLSSQVTSKTAKKGDPITARLKYDLKIGDRLVAKKGSVVNGHVNYVLKARTILHSLVSPERWYRNSGCVGLSFDEIINERGEHLPLSAQPSRQARIVKNKAEGRELGVNHYGQVTGPWAQQLRYKALRIGLNAALAPAGVFSFGAMPVALGVLGAANPSFAFSRPVGLNVRHRRIKGFAWGFLSGIPGSWLIEDTTVKGQEAIIKPGDEFYAELVQEFTGEPASDAQLMPGASTKLRGEVLSDKKEKGKKKK